MAYSRIFATIPNPGCPPKKSAEYPGAGNAETARMTIIRMVVDYQPHNGRLYIHALAPPYRFGLGSPR